MVFPHVSIKCHVQYVPGQVRCHGGPGCHLCSCPKLNGVGPDMEQKCNDVEHVKINQLNQTEHWTDSVFDIFFDLQHFVWQVPQVPSTLT